jgi:predicted transcriptional regulator
MLAVRMKRRRSLPPLGELEESVLEHLWKVGETDVRTAHRDVGVPRRITANTVGSALERLHRKRLVTRVKVSHAYRYRAAVERDELCAVRVLQAAGGLHALARDGVLAAFVDLVAESDEEALDQLAAAIAARKRRSKGESGEAPDG